MLPAWIIEETARERREREEREERERARLWIDTPRHHPRERPEPGPPGAVVIRIEVAQDADRT